MILTINAIIEWPLGIGNDAQNASNKITAQVERVLFIDTSSAQIVLFDIQDEAALPYWRSINEIEMALLAGEARLLDLDPYAYLRRPEDNIPLAYRQQRDDTWEKYIRPLVEDENGQPRLEIYDEQQRGQLIAKAIEETGRSKRLFYRDLRRYWRVGQVKNGLLPRYDRSGGRGKRKKIKSLDKRGRPSDIEKTTGKQTGVNVDKIVRRDFRKGIRLFYQNQEQRPLSQAYKLTLSKFFNCGYEEKNGVLEPQLPPIEALPTLRQFRYWYEQDWEPQRNIAARLGMRRYNLRHRPVLGSSLSLAFGPGSLYQIDATMADVYLVSTIDPTRIIGRPVLYLIVDTFSRMIAGFAVTLEGPNWLGATLGLANAMTDKVAFCAGHGITILPEQWPCHYLPERILADRGELEGYNADHVVNALGITVANTPPYRADWKGVVERYFRLTNDRVVKWLPGAVYPKQERGDRDYRLDACLTLDEFRQILIWAILEHNNEYRMDWYPMSEVMVRDKVEPYPVELWEWGIQNRAGALRTLPDNVIRQSLLPREEKTASIARDGIHFRELRYTCQRAEKEGWFARVRAHGRKRVTVAYDPRRADMIYLYLDGQAEPEVATLLDQYATFRGWDWYEVADFQARQKQESYYSKTRRLQSEAGTEVQIKQIVEQAKERQEAALADQPQSKSARRRGIRQNRQVERSHDHRQTVEAETKVETETNVEVETQPQTQNETGTNDYVPAPRNVELLRKLREQKLQTQSNSLPEEETP